MVTKIGSEVGVYMNYENNVLILLISSQKLYFGDDDAIYDVIIQEPVMTTDMKSAGIHFFQTYSTIFILDKSTGQFFSRFWS